MKPFQKSENTMLLFFSQEALVDYTGETLNYHTELFLIISGDEESCMLSRLQVLLFLHVYNFFGSGLLQIRFRKKHCFLFYRLPDFRILQAIPKCNMQFQKIKILILNLSTSLANCNLPRQVQKQNHSLNKYTVLHQAAHRDSTPMLNPSVNCHDPIPRLDLMHN